MSAKSYIFPEERFYQLEKEKQTVEGDDQISGPKIQRVPAILRQNVEFAKYCTPKIISIGPIHHGNETLKEGEHYKLLWTSMYLEEYCGQSNYDSKREVAQFLHKRIEDNLEELKKLFTKDAIGNRDDKDFAWLLFVDGCSLLYLMEKVDDHHLEALKLKLDQLMHMRRDMSLLENQLPLRVLELLVKVEFNVEHLMGNFMCMGRYYSSKEVQDGCLKYINPICQVFGLILAPLSHPSDEINIQLPNKAKPIHLLDYARSIYLPFSNDVNNDKDDDLETIGIWQTYKNLQDLKAAGIRVMTNEKDDQSWSNISFTSNWSSGELRLPPGVFNDVTPYFFRNLIALEMCPDYQTNYESCLYFSFMDSLIDNADDVKELRTAGVIQNLLGSDEELAKFINDLGTDLHTKMFNLWSTGAVAYSKKYIQVKRQIEKHYKNKWKTWLAQAYNTHFNTPWAILAFLAALLALALTFIQTWYSINPKK